MARSSSASSHMDLSPKYKRVNHNSTIFASFPGQTSEARRKGGSVIPSVASLCRYGFMAEQAGELLVSDQGRQLPVVLLVYFRVRRHREMGGRSPLRRCLGGSRGSSSQMRASSFSTQPMGRCGRQTAGCRAGAGSGESRYPAECGRERVANYGGEILPRRCRSARTRRDENSAK